MGSEGEEIVGQHLKRTRQELNRAVRDLKSALTGSVKNKKRGKDMFMTEIYNLNLLRYHNKG